MENACKYPEIIEHMFTALSASFRIWIVAAYGTSHRVIGGVAAVLAASATHEGFQGKSCEFRELDADSRTGPKFLKVPTAEVLRQINYLHGIKALTDEQAAKLLEDHTPRRIKRK